MSVLKPKPTIKIEDDYDENFVAKRKMYTERATRTQSKAQKRFDKRVLKALEGDKVSGRYISSMTVSLPCYVANEWTTIETGDKSQVLNFFNPIQFKDAEAVIFLGKVGTNMTSAGNGYEVETGNNTRLAPVRVLDSSVYMSFKNNSTMKMILEVYEIQGDGCDAEVSSVLFKNFYNAYATQTLKAGAAGTDIITLPLLPTLHSNMNMVPSVLQDFKIKKTVMKFQPGEEQTHSIQGPRNYTQRTELKLLSTGGWANWTLPGNGIRVMFRVISDINMAFYSSGTPPGTSDNNVNIGNSFNINHYPNTLTASGGGPGCIIGEIVRHYHIEQPDGAVPTAAGGAVVNFQPAVVFLQDYGTMTDNGVLEVMNLVPGSGTPGAPVAHD